MAVELSLSLWVVEDCRARARRKVLIIAGLVAAAFIAFAVATVVGPFAITPGDFLHGLFNPASVDDTTRTVLWKLRLPASVMAVLIGAALALAGARMQTILDNPLAEPFTLGISAAVTFAGIIGFIGLVGPHIARILVGEEQRFFAPASMAAGACLLATAHAVSITIIPGVAVPIGIITALVGVPFFVILIFSRRRTLWGS